MLKSQLNLNQEGDHSPLFSNGCSTHPGKWNSGTFQTGHKMTRFMLVFVSIFLSLLSRTVVAVYLGSCPYYFTENTASATQNYYSCYISACPGDTLVIGSCGSVSQSATCGGDQFLRLFDGEDYYSNEIAFDDDGCGNQCSQIIYTVPSWTICRNYFIHEGCYNNDRCGAVVEVTRLPAPSAKPTAAPSRAPTIRPSFRRTQNPTPRPSGQPSAHPSVEPTPGSTAILTLTSSKSLQPTPTNSPVSSPTVDPSLQPTSRPSTSSTSVPIALNAPSASPSAVSTETATRAPTSPVAEPIDESIAPQNDSSSDAINGGGIAGIAISCVILCAILIYAYYRCQGEPTCFLLDDFLCLDLCVALLLRYNSIFFAFLFRSYINPACAGVCLRAGTT